jgi:hypothetical protein
MKSLGDKLKNWRSLFESIKLHPEELQFIGEEHAELGRHLEEIEDLITQIDKHEAGLREATRRRLEVEGLAAELHGRIVFGLRARYGKRNPQLHAFGIQPHALRGERKKEREEPPEAPASG